MQEKLVSDTPMEDFLGKRSSNATLNSGNHPLVTLYQRGQRCGMCIKDVKEIDIPLVRYEVESMPSGELKITVVMQFRGDSVRSETYANAITEPAATASRKAWKEVNPCPL